MSPFRSVTTAALALAVLATTLTGCQLGEEPQDTSPIVIGVDLELSGPQAATGKAYQRALELKRDQLNASGALGGRKVELKVRDNRSDAAESQRNIGDFGNDASVTAVIMGGCNECAVNAVRTIDEKKVPTIALAASGAITSASAAQRSYVFKLAPNATDSADALTAELTRRGVKEAALLHSDDDYGREGVTTLRAEFTKARIKMTAVQAVKSTDTDVTAPVEALVEEEPDALVFWTPSEQAMLATTAAQKAKFKGAVFLDAAAAGELFLGASARSAEQATLVFTQTMVIDDVIATTPAKAARRQWFRDYTARFGGYNGFSSFAADAVQLIADAELRAGGEPGQVDRDGLRDVLETSQMDGLSGPIRMTPDNHSGLMPQALTTLVAQGGRWRLAG
ncbi:ABC transporter substrate-binding protein [Micromonospora echinospora]|uniref:Amino acid/amide ABC transporter substrate-binding protein, HAAT family n=1 Tax=Micromonospora echinospora TaxID=1877 RepID=A0A1C4XAA9_MICEC|nr:ABC transporter substrate-binding protein [Micromonospora echinospora]OZV82286.1 ABC transporter substrate-binding protein [Micromonospora echinospora]SCF05376.1 amino acid/amide ABC transporter substrate-binding protein, HAAT family [Micromonospora echinospora]